MNYTAYIQKNNGEFLYDFCFSAFEGFKYKGIPTEFFESSKEIPTNNNIIVVGSVESTMEYLGKIGVRIPNPINIPTQLSSYTNRKTEIMSMEEFRKNENFPIFIKPQSKIKEFPSGVLQKKSSIKLLLNDVPNDSIVLTSEVINMVSEYRVFIKNKKIIGLKHYFGNFQIFPDINTIVEMVNKFIDSPSSYSLDVAINDSGETILVECNDAWSIGNYGLDSEIYVSFLLNRWVEMTKNISNRKSIY